MRVGTSTFGQLAALLIILSLGLPISSEGGVFWTEDFENHLTPNWDTSACGGSPQDGCNAAISTDVPRSGTHSLKSHYPDITQQAGTYIDRNYPPTSNLWMRLYYYTRNFTYFTGAETKLLISKPNGAGGPTMYWHMMWGDNQMMAKTTHNVAFTCPNGAVDSACSLFPNMAVKHLANDTWYCIELHAMANTPGVANGVVEVFVDGTQTVGYYNLQLRSDSSQFSYLSHYTQMGLGDRYVDDLVVADTRIECSGSLPKSLPTDISPPSPPAGLTIR